jgi:hypothetical protein
MVSREGFETWLAYEWLFFKVFVVLAALVWLGQRVFGAIDWSALPLARYAVYGFAALVCLNLGLAWWIGRGD